MAPFRRLKRKGKNEVLSHFVRRNFVFPLFFVREARLIPVLTPIPVKCGVTPKLELLLSKMGFMGCNINSAVIFQVKSGQEKFTVSEPDISTIIQALPEFFKPETAAGVSMTIGFDISGEKGGQWTARIANQTCSVSQGLTESPNLTLMAKSQDLVDIFSGKLDPMKAFFQGKLKMKGSMSLAMKVTEFFSLDNDKLKKLGIEIS